MDKLASDDRFIVARKNWAQTGDTPKISINQQTYQRLQDAALQSGQSISAIARWGINFALDRLSLVDE